MSNFFYKFLSNPSNTIFVPKDNNIVYDIIINGVDKDTQEIIDLKPFCSISSDISFYNIYIYDNANISNDIMFDKYNIGVYLIPNLSIFNFSTVSLNELDRLYHQANAVLNFLIDANKYCIKVSELDNLNNKLRYYDTKNNAYVSVNKIDSDIFLGYSNNNILESPNINNGNTNVVLPEPDALQKKILSIADAQEWSDFFGTTQKEDVDLSHEKPVSGTIKITDFGIGNLSNKWIECNGQTLDIDDYNNIYEKQKTLINCNFPAINSGVGYISNVTNSVSIIDIAKEEFVRAVNTSNDLFYAKIGSNSPIQILDAGYIIAVNTVFNFVIGDIVKVIINNTYVLYNARFVGYRGGYGIIVCEDYNSYKTISKNNIFITKIDLYGVESYSNYFNVSNGNVIADFNKTYLNISNYYAGVGIRFDDNINGLGQVSMLIKNGLKLDVNSNIVLPNIADTLLSNDLTNLCFSSVKKVIQEDLSFDNINSIFPLTDNGRYKNYKSRQNILYKGFYFSDTASLNFQDPIPELYIHLYSQTTRFRFGVSAQQFLIPFYTMLALGILLIALPFFGSVGLKLTIVATAVITSTLAASRSVRDGIYYTLFLNFINNNQQSIDTRQKTLQLYKMYIHE